MNKFQQTLTNNLNNIDDIFDNIDIKYGKLKPYAIRMNRALLLATYNRDQDIKVLNVGSRTLSYILFDDSISYRKVKVTMAHLIYFGFITRISAKEFTINKYNLKDIQSNIIRYEGFKYNINRMTIKEVADKEGIEVANNIYIEKELMEFVDDFFISSNSIEVDSDYIMVKDYIISAILENGYIIQKDVLKYFCKNKLMACHKVRINIIIRNMIQFKLIYTRTCDEFMKNKFNLFNVNSRSKIILNMND